MTTFDEALHPRQSSGQFTAKEHTEPEIGLGIAAQSRLCSQHGGEWGDDPTCTNCTTADGAPVEYPFPPLRDGLLAHQVDVNVWLRSANEHGREDWAISLYRIDEDGQTVVSESLETYLIPDHQVPEGTGEEAWWTLDVAPQNIRRSAVAMLRVRDSDGFDRGFAAHLEREAAADREHFERTGQQRERARAAND